MKKLRKNHRTTVEVYACACGTPAGCTTYCSSNVANMVAIAQSIANASVAYSM